MFSIIPLRDFVIEVTKLIDVENVEANLIKEGKVLLEKLISDDDGFQMLWQNLARKAIDKIYSGATLLKGFRLLALFGGLAKLPRYTITLSGALSACCVAVKQGKPTQLVPTENSKSLDKNC